MAEAEEVIVEEVVEGVEEVHLVDEGVEEEVEEEVRRETGMIVLESNLTHSDVNSLVVYSGNLKEKKKTETDSLFIS